MPAGRSLLRSTTVPERNRGRSPCITTRVFLVFVKKEYALFVNHWRSLCVLCGFARKNHPRGNRMVKNPTLSAVYSLCISPAVGRMGINPTPTVAECSKVLIINVLHVSFCIRWLCYASRFYEGAIIHAASAVFPVFLAVMQA